MPLTAIDNPTLAPTLAPTLEHGSPRSAPGFTESLLGALQRGEDERAVDEQEARQAAEQLVASAFLLPLMSQLRKGAFEAEFMKGGMARDAFEQQLHTHLADEMVQRMDLPIVDAVTRFVTQRGPTDPASSGTKVDRHG